MSVTADVETLSPERLQERVRELGPWFHNLDLKGVKTAPEHFLGDYPSFKFRNFAHVIPPGSYREDGARHRLQRRLLQRWR